MFLQTWNPEIRRICMLSGRSARAYPFRMTASMWMPFCPRSSATSSLTHTCKRTLRNHQTVMLIVTCIVLGSYCGSRPWGHIHILSQGYELYSKHRFMPGVVSRRFVVCHDDCCISFSGKVKSESGGGHAVSCVSVV
jgi:hypothetical protein